MVARVSPPELPDTLQEAIKQFGEGPFMVGIGSPYAGRYDDDGILKSLTGGLMSLDQARQEEADYAARRAKYLAPEPEPQPQPQPQQGVMSLPLTLNQRYSNYLNQTNNITFEELMELYKRNLGIV